VPASGEACWTVLTGHPDVWRMHMRLELGVTVLKGHMQCISCHILLRVVLPYAVPREEDRLKRIEQEGWDRFAPISDTNKP
jgi:hypothetical protein